MTLLESRRNLIERGRRKSWRGFAFLKDFTKKYGLTKISRIKKKGAGDVHAHGVGLLRLKTSTSAVLGERTRLNEGGDEGIAGYSREVLKMRLHKVYKIRSEGSADHLVVFELRIGENAENPLVF